MNRILYQLSNHTVEFPDPTLALEDPDGLLAIGGDLSATRLINAYQHGIFPWFNDDDPIMWWSPSQRAIIELEEFHVSRSLKKSLNKHPFKVFINRDFAEVMYQCQRQRIHHEGTWISDEMLDAYTTLHKMGHAHSIEIWLNDQLVGGLYGIMLGAVFCGESMFHTMPNTSKLASWALVNWLKRNQGAFIDCQVLNPHTASLGAKAISRDEYLSRLSTQMTHIDLKRMWQSQELINIYEY
ncbi:leucyl/phenylalanyl-tRNA--protein transferase [Pseudoalteromonas tunicata]|uniref:leucyl/phenylalanyl-tRNA--protein transferase n=1 Tax=Pseudoalteromonas tunicata TaxID=314281 RepID=UPI00273F9726|nr:leucyl/phenylalanyl-tRNA--protein transferase [Pseudoalteromonas tunicata]MDP4983604.1 leucyl/phenylalanyl-tRNA--protein transferase [Pseudoalteromonas tunicata]MDP5214835.1 leucyl/phenylalanyl-tRNA--protein transferase [Pseudoalteromonas tunicata]